MKIVRKVDTDVFEGTVTYDMPLYEERIKLNKSVTYPSLAESGEVEDESTEDKIKVRAKKLDSLYDYSSQMKNIAENHVVELKLVTKNTEDRIEVNSIEELLMYEEGADLVGTFANTVLGGVKLGNVQPKQ